MHLYFCQIFFYAGIILADIGENTLQQSKINIVSEFLENIRHFKQCILERNFEIWYNVCERNNALNNYFTHVF